MPFDNIKTRMQSVGNNYTSMFDCGRDMLRQEGIKIFWRATTPRLVRLTVSACPSAGLKATLMLIPALERHYFYCFRPGCCFVCLGERGEGRSPQTSVGLRVW